MLLLPLDRRSMSSAIESFNTALSITKLVQIEEYSRSSRVEKSSSKYLITTSRSIVPCSAIARSKARRGNFQYSSLVRL
jgi:ssDNA-binding replication factor A large subunit